MIQMWCNAFSISSLLPQTKQNRTNKQTKPRAIEVVMPVFLLWIYPYITAMVQVVRADPEN